MATIKKTVRFLALLPLLTLGGIGCGGASTPVPLDGAYPIYGTSWSGTFSQVSAAQTGTVTLSVGQNGAVNGLWEDFNGLVYTLSGSAQQQGAIKGVFLNSSGGPNGTFSGGITTAGNGTNIGAATASGTITITVAGAFTEYTVSMSYNGVPRFSRR